MSNKVDDEIELEKEKIRNNKILKEEIDNLNKSLNSCIDIIYSSVAGKKTKEKLDSLKYENNMVYKNTNNKINTFINESKKNIEKLNTIKEESSRDKKDGRNE